MTPAERWCEALGAWAVPAPILAGAAESPWSFPPALFDAHHATFGLLHRLALSALPPGGSVLDVGCGGGAASVSLAAKARLLVGVDCSPAMLDSFAAAADEAGVAHREVLGEWPTVAGDVPVADVVVCRNVVYNVGDIVPFLVALSEHGTEQVVVELTESHPSVDLAPLWRLFWDLDRPDGPTAALLVEVVTDLGYHVRLLTETRPRRKAGGGAEHAEFVRRRLCLDPSRLSEVEAALAELAPSAGEMTSVLMSWPGQAGR